MERVMGTISDGDRVVVRDVPILMLEAPTSGERVGWQGQFDWPLDATPPHVQRFYRLQTSDGRSGQIIFVGTKETVSHQPPRFAFAPPARSIESPAPNGPSIPRLLPAGPANQLDPDQLAALSPARVPPFARSALAVCRVPFSDNRPRAAGSHWIIWRRPRGAEARVVCAAAACRASGAHQMRPQPFVVRPIQLAVLSLPFLAGCLGEPVPMQETVSLREARAGFKPKPVTLSAEREAVPDPPQGTFRKISYDSPAGKLAAYISDIPDDGRKRPAIIWMTGGDCNSVGDVWSPMPASDEQSASAYRKAGMVMMFPALRGGNDNPGAKEGFFGEVDDVLAAADYLARQHSVDPERIYLGGHSTGGTLVLLVSECSDRFRAVFAFGPVSDVSYYPSEFTPFDTSNRREVELRSPGRWLGSISARRSSSRGRAAISARWRRWRKRPRTPWSTS